MLIPARAAVPPKKDSVELLLDGMQGPQLERPRLTPQTDGQSHAAYHAEHLVRAAHTTPGEEPKVVVERRTLPATTRLDRAKVLAAIEQAEAQRRALATAAVPRPIVPRVVLALIAGLLVAMGVFAAIVRFRAQIERSVSLTARSTPTPRASSAIPMAAAAPTVSATQVAASASALPPTATSPSPVVDTPGVASAAAPLGSDTAAHPAEPDTTAARAPLTASGTPAGTAKKPPKPPPTASAPGLGEFETKLR
jgi:hypothetical protein